MRTHRVFSALQPWSWRTELLRELVGGEHLVAARIEPVTRGREPTAFLDLHFSDGERSITIPLVYVDLAQLDIREADPLLFPHAVLGVVSDARACEVIERVLPDLERRLMNGGFWNEEVLLYGDGTAFAAARARGFFGAAPLATALPRIAAAVYARRFATGKHVLAYGSLGAELAGFLSDIAVSCSVLGDDADASAWYGEFGAGSGDRSYDLALGSGPAPAGATVVVRTDGDAAGGLRVAVASPLPADLMLSFGDDASAAAATFSVVAAREPYARPVPDLEVAAVGRSAGRIAIVVRPDAYVAADSDSGEAAALAGALRREGFAVEVVTSVDALEAASPDLVHLFGVNPGGFARRVATWASDQRKPLVVHALHESPASGGYWGALVAPYCFSYSGDDRSVGTYLEMLGRRAVEVDGAGPNAPYAPPVLGLADAERVLALADVVLVNSERELAVVEALRPRRPTYIVPPLPTAIAAPGEPIGARVGIDPFVLVHAPIWPEANQLLLVRAAAGVGVPMVLAGAVADPGYAERLREFAPDQVSLLDEPSPATIATLYRTANVIVDAAWTARGHGRLATAAAFGAAVVCSQNRWIDLPEAKYWTVDPADVRSIARGIGEAWDAAVQSDTRIRATAGFAQQRLAMAASAIVATYARIVQAV